MDLATWAFSVADPDHYRPFARAVSRGTAYRPSAVPAGWQSQDHEIWTAWGHPDLTMPPQGWKIHVSATLGRAAEVLDVVARTCFEARTPFKHLTSELAFLYVHHKHAARPQAGKFCAIYPADDQAAGRLLERLAGELVEEAGPYILSDRRFGDSRTVHYRYGAFMAMVGVRPDGATRQLVRDGTGALVDDQRTIRFVVPDGITDPFAPPEPPPARPSSDGIRVGAYKVLAALAHSNAGGAYRAVDPAGRQVFMKEARAHNGLHWDGTDAQQRLRHEHRILTELHELAPGLAPEPIDYFREWEHEFLVTELVPGNSLADYVAHRNPLNYRGLPEPDYHAYLDGCRTILAGLADALDQLHRLGYRFGDVNPRNLLVTPTGAVRLIDFEACNRLSEPPIPMGTPGYTPEREEETVGTGTDEYGLSAIALSTILPLHQVAQRHPAALAHLRADASRYVQVPGELWELATRNFRGTPTAFSSGEDGGCLPTPGEVERDPVGCLTRLRDAVGRELAAAAKVDDPERVYPTVPRGYRTNTLCVAYGTAGVLHALHHARLPVDRRVSGRLRREALDRRDELPPGLHTGTAGIGWVLAELGHLEEAATLVEAAADHPTLLVSATWAEGMAGVGSALLALYEATHDERRLARAVSIGEALVHTGDLAPLVGANDAVGLLHGRAGVALFLYQLWQATGDDRYHRYGARLLHRELDRAIPMPGGRLGFPDNESARRAMAYLAVGSAGVGLVLTRYLAAGLDPDGRFSMAAPGVFDYVDLCLTMEPGLYQGLAGLAYGLADHADHAGAATPAAARERAIRLAAGLFKYAIPASAGRVRFLGEHMLRFSTELWSGSAGILLTLDRVLTGPRGQFFTLDQPATAATESLVAAGAGHPKLSEPSGGR